MRVQSHVPQFVSLGKIIVNINEIEYLGPKMENVNHTTLYMKSGQKLHTRYRVEDTARMLHLDPIQSRTI